MSAWRNESLYADMCIQQEGDSMEQSLLRLVITREDAHMTKVALYHSSNPSDPDV